MMALIKGQVAYRGNGFVIIENEGVGFKVWLPEAAAMGLADEAVLYLHEVIREDQRELFGFPSVEALEFFWKLISVSGLGPKGAHKIIFAGSVSELKARIMSGDLAFLTSIPGLGNKTAQKIILELKGALAKEPEAIKVDEDALEALIGLGYSRKQAQDALTQVTAENTDDRIRLALKRLAR